MQIRRFLYLIPLAMLLSATGCSGWGTDTNPTRSVTPNPQRVAVVQPAQPGTTEMVYQNLGEYEQAPRREQNKKRRGLNPTRRTQSRVDSTIVEMPVNMNERSNRALAHHHTEFNAKEKSRNTNITLAANSINGKVVQPGQVFSFNEAVGPTIESRGYEKGMIYIDGEKSEGFGGGVCQVSSTLHVAARDAGMTIIERHDHSLPVGYAKSGEEAATSYGAIDFKFKNDKNHAVVIRSNVEGGKINVSLHSA